MLSEAVKGFILTNMKKKSMKEHQLKTAGIAALAVRVSASTRMAQMDQSEARSRHEAIKACTGTNQSSFLSQFS
jgi:hypothetical protein